MKWRYLFFELNGDGTERFIRGDVPVVSPNPTRKLSSPHSITGGIRAGSAGELHEDDGSTVLKRWKSTVYVADDNDKIWVGGILADYTIDDDVLQFDFTGFTAYPKDQPYGGEISAIAADPLNLTRQLWEYVQDQPGGNLGLVLDSTTSPVKIGTPPTNSGSSVDGPITLNWWSTGDIASRVDDWAKSTPFDYLEDHVFLGEEVTHTLRLGYPSIGTLQPDLRFVLGENVRALPSEDYPGTAVITEVWVFGAGEGRDRIRAVASVVPRDSLRRVEIVDDKSITSFADAQNRARDVLMGFQPDVPGAGITELEVENHSNAEFGTFDVGDTVIYSGGHKWGDVLIWVKIVSIGLLSNGHLRLSVLRADTLTS
jgi:hypothetical protein